MIIYHVLPDLSRPTRNAPVAGQTTRADTTICGQPMPVEGYKLWAVYFIRLLEGEILIFLS